MEVMNLTSAAEISPLLPTAAPCLHPGTPITSEGSPKPCLLSPACRCAPDEEEAYTHRS